MILDTDGLAGDTAKLTEAIKELNDFEHEHWSRRLEKAADEIARAVTDDPDAAEIVSNTLFSLFRREVQERRDSHDLKVRELAAKVAGHLPKPQQPYNHQQTQLQGQVGQLAAFGLTGRQ